MASHAAGYADGLGHLRQNLLILRSSVSRQAIERSAEQLRQLRERRWDNGSAGDLTPTGSVSAITM